MTGSDLWENSFCTRDRRLRVEGITITTDNWIFREIFVPQTPTGSYRYCRCVERRVKTSFESEESEILIRHKIRR